MKNSPASVYLILNSLQYQDCSQIVIDSLIIDSEKAG